METAIDLKSQPTRYIELVGKKDYEAFAQILAPDLTFRGERLASVELFFDRASFAPISQALAKRTAA